MKLKLKFGLDKVEFVSWWKSIQDFPKNIRYQGSAWGFIMYETEPYQSHYDYTFTFSITTNYPGNFYDIPSFFELFRADSNNGCQCGAKHDRHFPNTHMFFCKLFKEKT